MRYRRVVFSLIFTLIILGVSAAVAPEIIEEQATKPTSYQTISDTPLPADATAALKTLEELPIKGRAPKTGYSRAQFGDGWASVNGCTTRQIILHRDLTDITMANECTIASGILQDPYTGETIHFSSADSSAVQIDHIVALSDAWQKGAQQLTKEQRQQLANDPLELLAVDGPANQQKGDGDAATWLPKNKAFRCTYIERQVIVKQKYSLWVTDAEKTAMIDVLKSCTNS